MGCISLRSVDAEAIWESLLSPEVIAEPISTFLSAFQTAAISIDFCSRFLPHSKVWQDWNIFKFWRDKQLQWESLEGRSFLHFKTVTGL